MTSPAPRAECDGMIVLRRAQFSYDGRTTAASADLELEPGSFTGIVGPSGAGKTTILRALAGQLRPVAGRVGLPRGLRVGYVPQIETIDWHFPITVAEAVMLGRPQSGPWPWPRAADRAERDAVLERLHIGELARRPLRTLSGGQQQRVFLARALMRRPDLLLLDEPTSGVDVRTRHQILDLLAELQGAGLTVVLTTHDLNGVATMLPHVVCMNHRVVAAGSPADVFTSAVLRATFGTEMVVFEHDGMLLTADAPLHGPRHEHHVHLHHGHDAAHDHDEEHAEHEHDEEHAQP